MKFVAIDIETVNGQATSVAVIGCVGIDYGGRVIETKEFRIRPFPFEFDDRSTAINGLSKTDFVNCPSFSEIWDDFQNFILDYDFCVAHNASFDFSVIKACCEKYNLQYKNFVVVDSLHYAREAVPGLPSYALSSLCEYFSIDFCNHHDALCDAKATAELMCLFNNKTNATLLDVFCMGNAKNFSQCKARKSLGFGHSKKSEYTISDDDVDISVDAIRVNLGCDEFLANMILDNIHKETKRYVQKSNHNWNLRAKDVAAANVPFRHENVFCTKNVVISGDLETMTRKDAYSVLKACGAVPCDSVTMKTDYLITNSEVETGKIKKAREYIARGIKIEIIDEGKFVKILEDSYGAD